MRVANMLRDFVRVTLWPSVAKPSYYTFACKQTFADVAKSVRKDYFVIGHLQNLIYRSRFFRKTKSAQWTKNTGKCRISQQNRSMMVDFPCKELRSVTYITEGIFCLDGVYGL